MGTETLFAVLSSFMVNLILSRKNQFGNRNELIALFLQTGNDGVQSLGSVLCTVVHEDDRTVAKMLVIQNTVSNLLCSVVLPVKRIGIGYSFRWKRDMEKRDGCGVLNETSMDGNIRNKNRWYF